MTKDYACHSYARKSRRKRNSIIIIIVIALATASLSILYNVKYQRAIFRKRTLISTPQIQQKTKTSKTAKNNTPDLDFYTLLSKGTSDSQ